MPVMAFGSAIHGHLPHRYRGRVRSDKASMSRITSHNNVGAITVGDMNTRQRFAGDRT